MGAIIHPTDYKMLSIEQAQKIVLETAQTLSSQAVALHDATGLILAEAVVSDIDSPPHDKAMVDGYALQVQDLQQGRCDFKVLELITAGQVPQQQVTSGTATQIMTGAPIPDGADCVVMVEQVQQNDNNSIDNDSIQVEATNFVLHQNIMFQGTSLQQGKQVLSTGKRIRHIEAGLLAEVGCYRPLVYPQPTVAVLATGNELVSAESIPSEGQIRNSNGPMLNAAVIRCGGKVVNLGIATDDSSSLSAAINTGLRADILLLSGGVSAGVLDLVPQVLQEQGVSEIFHKVKLKPGKPLWFGVKEEVNQTCLVFGLPGNPVGGLVCFELFVRLAIEKLSGQETRLPNLKKATLIEPYKHKGGRITYFPASITFQEDGRLQAAPLTWQGSGDMATLCQADGFIVYPATKKEYQTGEEVSVYRID